VWLTDVIPALVAAGTPVFGRETNPTFTSAEIGRGTVKMGDMIFKGYDTSSTATKPAVEKKPQHCSVQVPGPKRIIFHRWSNPIGYPNRSAWSARNPTASCEQRVGRTRIRKPVTP